jgi:hypothetical protein
MVKLINKDFEEEIGNSKDNHHVEVFEKCKKVNL